MNIDKIQITVVKLACNDIILGFNPFGTHGSEYVVNIVDDGIITIYNKEEMMEVYGLTYLDAEMIRETLTNNDTSK